MAPKAKTTKATTPSAAQKAAQLQEELLAQQKKVDISNMLTQLRKPTGTPEQKANKAAVFSMYGALARSHPDKGEMLSRWLSDKTCGWKNDYVQSKTVETTKEDLALTGHGTKSHPQGSS